MKTTLMAVIVVVLLQGGMVIAQPPDDNTLAYWKIDEGSGDFVEDSSQYGNHGTVENATWTTDAMTGGAALEFNGQNARVAVPDSPSLHPATGNITIGAWIKVFSDPTGWPNAGSIVHKQGLPMGRQRQRCPVARRLGIASRVDRVLEFRRTRGRVASCCDDI